MKEQHSIQPKNSAISGNSSSLFTKIYSFLHQFFENPVYNVLLKNLKFKGNEVIFDFGCGPGNITERVRKKLTKESKIICLDVNESFIENAKNKLRNYSNIEYLLGDLKEQNLDDIHFDIILCLFVLHHVNFQEHGETIEIFKRILKSNGKIFIAEHLNPDHGFDKNHLIDLLKEHELDISILFKNKKEILFELRMK